ncbi:GAF and ANTAR domain-containing protein [Brevibacterium renqingii]|uniref:GAF and ANTAR domain-containing protein n=1 Tax=Brevibacterium renqingii TaxID=2776916 RepID=UPI001ADF09B1|nr:GAF and ANTAR domain-containing protein [Brevibacterium renqingii]
MVDLPLDELSTLFARMNSMLLDERTVDNAVVLLSEAAQAAIPRALGAGTTVLDPVGRPVSTGSTDAVVAEADEQQYTTGEGPCLSAWAEQKPMLIDDAESDDRWPRWSKAVSHLPIRSVLSVPLIHGEEAIGAIKVYSASAGAFGDETVRLLGLFEGPASALLAHVQSTDLPARLSDSLQSALTSRDTINMAKGVLMAEHALDADTAMTRLIGLAREGRQSLLACAQGIVASTQRGGD